LVFGAAAWLLIFRVVVPAVGAEQDHARVGFPRKRGKPAPHPSNSVGGVDGSHVYVGNQRGPGEDFSTIGATMTAVLIMGVLGTVLNDAGIWVWAFVAGVALFPALWFWARTWPRPAGRTSA